MTSRRSNIFPAPHTFLRLVAALYLLLLFNCIPSDIAAEQNVTASNSPIIVGTPSDIQDLLTQEEKDWLQAHPDIALGGPTTYPPFVIKRNDGAYVGMAVDYLEAVSRLLNHRIRLHIEDPWIKVQEMAAHREIDGLVLGAISPSRTALHHATIPVFNTYYSVFARSKDEYQIRRFSDLDGMRIGYREGGNPKDWLEKLPSADPMPYGTNEALTQALLRKEVDVVVSWISYDFFRKDKLQGTIDNILLIEEFPVDMVTHIRKDWPEFVSIMNKVIAVMQRDELPRIMNKWFVEWPNRPKAPRVHLTREEKAWLAQNNPVTVRIVDYPPYQIIKGDESPRGIVVEFLKLIEARSGIRFNYEVTDQPFTEFIENIKQNRGPDMTAVIVSTPEREQYLSFTEPYLTSPYVIFIRQDDSPILDIQGLFGKKIAVPQGFVVHKLLESNYPKIKLALFDSDAKALQAVATGQADAYIGNLTAASHIIHQKGLTHLKVTAAAPFGDQVLSMGIRKDELELTSIINKALASISEDEKTAIRNKYFAIKFEQGINKAEALKWILIAGGATSGILLIFLIWNRQMSREIGRRKQMELAMKEAKENAEAANQAKSVFLANMSHELRTPLNAILGFSRMLTRDKDFATDQKDKLTTINRSGEHLLSMINDILDLSKIEVGREELQEHPFDLVALLKETSVMIQSRATEKGISVAVETEKVHIPHIKADLGKVRQVLVNLLGNAVKFTDEGSVTIRCSSKAIPEEPEQCRIVIEVEDTGPGIDPSRLTMIFEPFVQEGDVPERRGTGLGLSICKQYTEFMGGTIEVESEVGRGSLFRVQIPAKEAEATEVKESTDDTPKVIGLAPTEKPWKILIADDNPENLLLLRSLLEEVGFSVLEAQNGQEAVELFKKESPDFIWMDMRMPVMDGYEAVGLIRQLPGGETVPISAITASAFREQRQDILAAGCTEVVIKPFQTYEIFEVMGRLMDIAFIYESDTEAMPDEPSEVALTAAMLSALPEDIREDLRQSSLTADREAISEVIDRIRELSPDTAKGLQTLLDDFKIARIHELLLQVEG